MACYYAPGKVTYVLVVAMYFVSLCSDLQSTFSSVSLRDNETPLPDDEDESKMEKEIQ